MSKDPVPTASRVSRRRPHRPTRSSPSDLRIDGQNIEMPESSEVMTTEFTSEIESKDKHRTGGARDAKANSSPGNRESSDGNANGGALSPPKNSFLPSLLLFAFIAAVGAFLIAVSLGMFDRGVIAPQRPSRGPIPEQYDALRAMTYLRDLCELGPRPSGSAAMERQQRYLDSFFQERGAKVTRQVFETRNPNDGSPVEMTNLIASWNTGQEKRYIFCAHYDTRPFPDRDRTNPKGVFVGANDGASGVAGLMELANQFEDLPSDIGVDLVAFDGEEFVWEDGRDNYFLGSTYFANQYKNQRAADLNGPRYQAGVLFDMIGDKELKIYYEQNSLKYAKPVARDFWKEAQRLGVKAFVMRPRHNIRDDHLPLNQIAGIPTIDVIDFDYPRPGIGAPSYWHTEQDTPDNCSGESIAAVVWVAHQWLLSKSSAPSKNNPGEPD